jgi:hypothetical protein
MNNWHTPSNIGRYEVSLIVFFYFFFLTDILFTSFSVSRRWDRLCYVWFTY